MKIFTPYSLTFLGLFCIVSFAAVFTFSKGLQRLDRKMLVGGFVLSALAGGLLDYFVQVVRLAILLGQGPSA